MTTSFSLKSYAQVCEDLLAAYYLKKDKNVTYIDVGCLWPMKFSNTYYFYERNGSGFCIDPNPSIEKDFTRERPRDKFINQGVSDKSGEIIYHSFENPVFNTFVAERADQLIKQDTPGRRLKSKFPIHTRPLIDILIENDWLNIYGNKVDFLSVDVEGFEYKVISSLDFKLVRPKLIVLEEVIKIKQASAYAAEELLLSLDYKIVGRTGHDVFYLDSTSI